MGPIDDGFGFKKKKNYEQKEIYENEEDIA